MISPVLKIFQTRKYVVDYDDRGPTYPKFLGLLKARGEWSVTHPTSSTPYEFMRGQGWSLHAEPQSLVFSVDATVQEHLLYLLKFDFKDVIYDCI
jgi:hypothetical protein